MALADLRMKLAAARKARKNREDEEKKSQIEDLIAELKMMKAKRKSSIVQLENDARLLEEIRAERREVEEYKDYLEDYESMVTQYEEEISRQSVAIEASRLQSHRMDIEIANAEAKLDILQGHPHSTEEPDSKDSSNCYFKRHMLELLESCHPDVFKYVQDLKEITERIPIYERDQQACAILLRIAGDKCRLLMCQERTSDEDSVLNKCLGIMKRLWGEYQVNQRITSLYLDKHIDWQHDLDDAKQEWRNHINPEAKPIAPIPASPNVPVRFAKPTSVRMPPILRAIRQAKAKNEAPHKEPEKLASDLVLGATKGRKAAVLAGGADRNESMRRWMEEEFQFKEVRWYDSDGSRMVQSAKNGHLDFLFVFPRWHTGWKKYAEPVEQHGAKVVVLLSKNKRMVCNEIEKALVPKAT